MFNFENNTPVKTMSEVVNHPILVVDDNLPMRKALTETLKFLNYRTMEAGDGLEALKIIEESVAEYPDHSTEKLSLVICDLSMPIMDGRDLLLELANRRIKVPFVMLSGYIASSDLEDLKRRGLAGWLQKPADIVQISSLLEKILQ